MRLSQITIFGSWTHFIPVSSHVALCCKKFDWIQNLRNFHNTQKNVQFLANTKIKSAVRSLLCIMWPTHHSYTFVKQTVIKINDYVGMILITANGDGNFRRRKIPVRRTLATNVGKIQILNSHSARVEYEMHKYIHTERKRWIDCCRASKHTHSTAMTSKRSRLYMFGWKRQRNLFLTSTVQHMLNWMYVDMVYIMLSMSIYFLF